jgi:hypothetical protein
MDVNTRSTSRSAGRGRARELEGYTVHFLSLDGTIATVRTKPSDDEDTFQLTVEIRDRKSERKLPADAARNPRSPEFVTAVREMKAELLGHGRAKDRRRLS